MAMDVCPKVYLGTMHGTASTLGTIPCRPESEGPSIGLEFRWKVSPNPRASLPAVPIARQFPHSASKLSGSGRW